MKSSDEKTYQINDAKKHYDEKSSRNVMIEMFFNNIVAVVHCQ